MTQTQLRQIVDELIAQPHRRPGGRFAIRYALREPPRGRARGLRGVEDVALVDCYSEALEHAFEYLTDLNWLPPRTDPDLDYRVPVYVYDAPLPFTAPHRRIYSLIGLRSEIGEPTFEACLRRARVDASHEATHLFTHRHRPINNYARSFQWFWFDEATAVFFERLLCPDNDATLRYALDWIVRPEHPMELGRGYAMAWFVQHLVDRHGIEFLRDVWHQAEEQETPIDAISRLLGSRSILIEEEDLALDHLDRPIDRLIHGYALRAFGTEQLDARAFRRYKERKYSHVACISDDPLDRESCQWRDSLGSLGCRYYKVYFGDKRPRPVRLLVRPTFGGRLRASATLICPRGQAAWVPLLEDGVKGEPRLEAAIDCDDQRASLVLAVVNLESGATVRRDRDPYLDYAVTVEF